MGIWYPLGMKWRHTKTVEGASPDIVPPLGVMLFIPLAAVWLVIVLFYSFWAPIGAGQQVLLALFGVLAPIAIAYGVVTNRRWTRVAILLTLLINVWVIVLLPHVLLADQLRFDSALAFAMLVWAGVVLYFCRGKAPRTYYLLLGGKPLPDALKGVDLSPPRAFVYLVRHLAYISEWLLVILAIAIFVGMFLVLGGV